MTNGLHTPTARRRAALALLAGPIVTVAGMAATPWESEPGTAAYQAALAASPTRGQIAACLLVFGYSLLALAVATVALYATGAHRRLRIAAGVLAFLGGTLMPGMVNVDFYDLALATTLPVDQAVEVADQASGYGLRAVTMAPAMIGFVLGPIVAAVCAWRAGLAGAWAPAVLVLGMVAPAVAFSPGVLIGSTALIAVVFAGIAAGVVRGPRARGEAVPAAQAVPA